MKSSIRNQGNVIEIHETCSCGATFDGVWPRTLAVTSADAVERWRRNHRHQPSKGSA